MRILVSSKLNDFFEEIEGDVIRWVSDYPVKLTISLNVKKKITDIVEDIKVVLDTNLEGAFSIWSENTLMPFLDQSASGLKRDLEQLTSNFEADLQRTRVELLGTQMTPEDLSLESTGPKSALERALAAAGGFFLMGFSGAGLGAMFGWREVMSAILPHVGIVIFSTALGLPIIPVMLTTGTIKGVKSANKIIEQVKIEISKAYQRQLRGSVSAQSERIAQQLDKEFDQLSEQLERGLQMQIDSVSEQVETAMRKQEEGQQAVDAKISEINSIEKQLSIMSIDLVEFLTLLDQG